MSTRTRYLERYTIYRKEMSVWLREHRNKHSRMRCGKKFRIKRRFKYRGIPEYCLGHVPKTTKGKKCPELSKKLKGRVSHRKGKKFGNAVFESRFGKFYRENDQKHVCKCGCSLYIQIKTRHYYIGIPSYISGHNSNKGWKQSPEFALKKSIQMKAWYAHNKHPRGMLGKKQSEEWRINHSLQMLGTKQTEYAKKRASLVHKNKIVSQETCDLISKNTKGKPKPKVREALKGRVLPKEVCDKISKSQIQRIIENGGGSPSSSFYKRGRFYSFKNKKELPYDSSYELRAFLLLEKMTKIKSYGRCHFYINYILEEKLRRYNPDILVEYITGTKEVIEIKPISRVSEDINQMKFKAATKYCGERNMKFKVWTEQEVFDKKIISLDILKKMTVQELFNKYGSGKFYADFTSR